MQDAVEEVKRDDLERLEVENAAEVKEDKSPKPKIPLWLKLLIKKYVRKYGRGTVFWVLVAIGWGIIAIKAPDNPLTKLGERLPYFWGVAIAAFHAFAGDLVQANRAVVVAVVSGFAVHILAFIPFLIFFNVAPDTYYSFFGPKEGSEGADVMHQTRKTKGEITGCARDIYDFLPTFESVKVVWRFLRLCSCLAMFIGYLGALPAFVYYGNQHLNEERTERLNWMQDFSELRVLDLIIPGSHDSGAIEGTFTGSPFFLKFIEPFSATNKLSITDQLKMGVRYIDLRLCGAAKGEAWMCHGPVLHYDNVAPVLDEIVDFVEANPSEIVIVFAKPESAENVADSVETAVYNPIFSNNAGFIEKLISPFEAFNTSIGSLTAQGKNIIFGTDSDQASAIFKTVDNLWNASLAPIAYVEDFYYEYHKFEAHMIENICTGSTLGIFGPPTAFPYVNKTETLKIVNGQMSGAAVTQVVYDIFPVLGLSLTMSPYEMALTLEGLAKLTHPLLLDLIRSPTCTGLMDFNIITYDFLDDDIIQAVIDRNYA